MVSERFVKDINDSLRIIEARGRDTPEYARSRGPELVNLSAREFRERGLILYRRVSVGLRKDGAELVRDHSIDLLVSKGCKIVMDVTISNGTAVAIYKYDMPDEVQKKLRALSALSRR